MARKKQLPVKIDKSEAQLKDFFDMVAPSAVKFMADHFIFGDTYRCNFCPWPCHLCSLWLWDLRDLAIIGTALLVSVLAIAQFKIVMPLGLTLGNAFLKIRLEDNTVLDYIRRGFRYFVTTQQYYEWQNADIGSHTERG